LGVTFVTTQYGPVSDLQCTNNFNKAVVTERVEKWKDSARTDTNAVVDLLGDTGAPQPQSPQAASINGRRSPSTI
jgi:hypothetical protein